MRDHNLNYNDLPPTYIDVRADGADSHGRAALILVESLIHGLLARSVIGVADAIEIVDAAIEVEEALASDAGMEPGARRAAASALAAIAGSLSRDLPIEPNDEAAALGGDGMRS